MGPFVISLFSAATFSHRCPDGNGPDAVKASEMCIFEMPAGTTAGASGMVYEGCDGTTANARGVWRIARAFAQ